MFEASMFLVIAVTFPVSPIVIVIAGLVLAAIVAVVAVFLLRSGKGKGAATGNAASNWQPQNQQHQAATGGWNQQGMGAPAQGKNAWSQPQQQGGWGAPQQQQQPAAGWGATQASWNTTDNAQQGANAWGNANNMPQQAANPWGNPSSAPQQEASPWGGANNAQQQAAEWGTPTANQWGTGAQGANQWGQNTSQPPWDNAPAPNQQDSWEQGGGPTSQPIGGQPAPPAYGGSGASWNNQAGFGNSSGQATADAWCAPPATQDVWVQPQENSWNIPLTEKEQQPPTAFSGNSNSSQKQTGDEQAFTNLWTPPSRGPGEAISQKEVDVRYSDISFPSHVAVGQQEELRIAITRKALNRSAIPLSLKLPSDKTQLMKVDVYVVVAPLDFDIEGSHIRTIEVPYGADSLPVLFKLTAKGEGKKTIAIEFFQNFCYLGRAELETTVEKYILSAQSISVQLMLETATTLAPPDLTILFDRLTTGNDKYYYRYRLYSPLEELELFFKEFRSPETNITPQGILEETFNQLNFLLKNPPSSVVFFARLNSIGMNLYRRLFEDDFKRLYWNKLRHKVKSIVVISFEPWIPWEILRPFNIDTNEAEEGFLCEKFNLTRWLSGGGFPDKLILEPLGLIISASSLNSAKLESEEIKRLLGAKVKDIVSSAEAVFQVLRTDDLSGLHFACHGAFNRDSPDMSRVYFDDDTWISPIDIEGDGLAFGKKRPIIFLNACETSQDGYALTGLGGWAEAFIGRAKCSSFIGSIWKANDESASKFAVAFYTHLLEGTTVAESVRLARQGIRQAGDPTWLSYAIYANPLAHITLTASNQA